MTLSPLSRSLLAIPCLALAPLCTLAQRSHGSPATVPAPAGSYGVANEVSLQGTVLSYNENSSAPPLGTHALLQTTSGNVDVHLGDARLLHAANMKLTQGATVRFIGQSQTIGSSTVFLARLVQVGTQVVAVRSEHGLVLAPAVARQPKSASTSASSQGGAR